MNLQKSFKYADLQFKKHLLLLLSIIKTVEYIFSGFFEKSKDLHLSEIKSFCNIINYTIHYGVSMGGLYKLKVLFSKDGIN